MTDKPLSRVLLTNDDGFDAPGLAALADVARGLADEVWIIAPQQDQSGMAQSITLNGPLRCVARGERAWAASGTPADCVILGLAHLMEHARPDMVLSGINAGANLGGDANISGTLGAAFTAAMMGVPSIALSIDCLSRKKVRWDTARAVLPGLMGELLKEKLARGQCLSVNIPDLPADKIAGVARTRLSRMTVADFIVDKREDLRENDYYWLYPQRNENDAGPGTDMHALDNGLVSVSLLTLDRDAALPLPLAKSA